MYTKCIILLTLLGTAAGCSQPGQSIAAAGAEGARFGPTAESIVRNTLTINPCPPGFHAIQIGITSGSSAVVTDVNGRVGSAMAANGQRSQRCVQNY